MSEPPAAPRIILPPPNLKVPAEHRLRFLAEPGHRVARVGAAFHRALRSPVTACRPCRRPRPTPSVFPSSTAVSGRAQGEAGGSVSPGTLPAAEVGAMPTWHRNSLGVGRVARRARLVIKPYENRLPRLTLKAGYKEGLPTIPTAVCGAICPSIRAGPFLNEMHPNAEYY